jgi:hypothetical protein
LEIWANIPGYENIYEASTEGRIRTAEGKTTFNKKRGVCHWKQRILKHRGDNYQTGYRVGLWKDGKCKDWLVARLVAMTFIRLPLESETVNHIDGNRFNNFPVNLEWLSLADNIRHGFKTGLYPQNPVYLIEKSSYKLFLFRSQAEAARFLHRRPQYISKKLIHDQHDLGEYVIDMLPKMVV